MEKSVTVTHVSNLGLLLGISCLVLGCTGQSRGEPGKPAAAPPPMDHSTFDAAGIAALEQEKATRTPAQQKMDSQLVAALKQSRGEWPSGAPKADLAVQADGRVLVDLDATVSPALLAYIKHSGGHIVNSFEAARRVRATIPLAQLEALAARDDVKFISPAILATTNPIVRP